MCVFVHTLDENGIVFEVEVSRDEALATLDLYKQLCPGQSSLSSLQGVLQAMDRSGVGTHNNLTINSIYSSYAVPLTIFPFCFGVYSTHPWYT